MSDGAWAIAVYLVLFAYPMFGLAMAEMRETEKDQAPYSLWVAFWPILLTWNLAVYFRRQWEGR